MRSLMHGVVKAWLTTSGLFPNKMARQPRGPRTVSLSPSVTSSMLLFASQTEKVAPRQLPHERDTLGDRGATFDYRLGRRMANYPVAFSYHYWSGQRLASATTRHPYARLTCAKATTARPRCATPRAKDLSLHERDTHANSSNLSFPPPSAPKGNSDMVRVTSLTTRAIAFCTLAPRPPRTNRCTHSRHAPVKHLLAELMQKKRHTAKGFACRRERAHRPRGAERDIRGAKHAAAELESEQAHGHARDEASQPSRRKRPRAVARVLPRRTSHSGVARARVVSVSCMRERVSVPRKSKLATRAVGTPSPSVTRDDARLSVLPLHIVFMTSRPMVSLAHEVATTSSSAPAWPCVHGHV